MTPAAKSTWACLLLLNLTLSASAALADHPLGDVQRLVVDFTNSESRSISVRLGSADGIEARMNFAVLDSTGLQIAAFYPHEILNDRFWSGPLEKEDFRRIRIGDAVVPIVLDREAASRLRSRYEERFAALRTEKRKARLRALGEEGEDLAERINELDVRSARLGAEIGSLQGRLDAERERTGRQVGGLQEEIEDLREERSELLEDRRILLDRRDSLLRRSSVPQDRVSDMNREIADLDREIGRLNLEIEDLRDEIRELRVESVDLEADIRELRNEQRDLGVLRSTLVRSLDEVEQEIRELERILYGSDRPGHGP